MHSHALTRYAKNILKNLLTATTGITDPGYNRSPITHHRSLGNEGYERGGGVGRGRDWGVDLGVGVGRGVEVGVGVDVAVAVAVAVAVGVGVGDAPPPGAWIPTIIGEPVLKKPTVALAVCGG